MPRGARHLEGTERAQQGLSLLCSPHRAVRLGGQVSEGPYQYVGGYMDPAQAQGRGLGSAIASLSRG